MILWRLLGVGKDPGESDASLTSIDLWFEDERAARRYAARKVWCEPPSVERFPLPRSRKAMAEMMNFFGGSV